MMRTVDLAKETEAALRNIMVIGLCKGRCLEAGQAFAELIAGQLYGS